MKSIQLKITSSSIKTGHYIKKIAETAAKFNCDIYIVIGTTKANAKSHINLYSAFANAKVPCKIEIQTSGWEDEQDALDAIAKLF